MPYKHHKYSQSSISFLFEFKYGNKSEKENDQLIHKDYKPTYKFTLCTRAYIYRHAFSFYDKLSISGRWRMWSRKFKIIVVVVVIVAACCIPPQKKSRSKNIVIDSYQFGFAPKQTATKSVQRKYASKFIAQMSANRKSICQCARFALVFIND